jgi:hypothetical protein
MRLMVRRILQWELQLNEKGPEGASIHVKFAVSVIAELMVIAAGLPVPV